MPDCQRRRCRYIAIQLANFSSAAHEFTCANSRDGDFASFTSSQDYVPAGCWTYGRGITVWVSVDAVRSNTLDWA